MAFLEFQRRLDRLTRDTFTQELLPLVRSDEFSALASGLGSPDDAHMVGIKLQQAGFVEVDPGNEQEIRSAAKALTAKTYELYYNKQHS